jgi:type II secretion system protein D
MTLPTSTPYSSSGEATPEKTTFVQFPHANILDVLSFYEQLTGKRTIRDANLVGPELSITVPNEIPVHEAIGLIESSLLLNGYTLIPVDEKTVKILGPSRPARSEGLPLYVEESQLPQDGDKLVSFYKPLRFLGPDEAISIINTVVPVNAYASYAPVANTSAIVVTEKTPIIRKILALLDIVDREPSQIITEFVPLQRADAEKVVETLTTMFGGGSSSGSHPATAPQGNQGGTVATGGDVHLLSGKAQFIADKRTNRILIVVKAENYKYLRELIAKLDQPADSAQPLVRPLSYLSVSDVYPVLIDMLKAKDDDSTKNGASASATPQSTPNQNQNQNQNQNNGQGSSGGVGSQTTDTLTEWDKSAPQSSTIGSISIIADPNANSIIIYGPPEAQAKAKGIIDLLDQRPKQVYLAAVIGQLQLTEGVDYGATWLAKINNGGNQPLLANTIDSTASSTLSSLVTNVVTSGLNSIPGALGGLTIYGTVAKGIATYANFLESTGKFRTISRPVVYTSNNKQALISSGRSIPFAGSSLTSSVGAVGTNSANAISSTVQYQNADLELKIIPLINSDREVQLKISQVNNTQQGSTVISGNSVPNIDTQKLTTTVRVPNGSTIVLGGLISDDKTTDDNGIPYVNRIPIIGPLLGGHTKKSRTRSELVIMIQPIVIDSNDAMEKVSAQEGAESELGKRARDIKNKLEPTPSPTPKKKGFHLFSLPKIDNF